VLRKVRRGEFARPRLLDATIDPALAMVCLKAMALEQEDRYATVQALADDIERWMADEPVTAWHEPLSRQARRWARQNRTTVAAVASAALVALAGAVQAQANGRLERAIDDLETANQRITRSNANLKSANEREK
jgi:hypothetical protein